MCDRKCMPSDNGEGAYCRMANVDGIVPPENHLLFMATWKISSTEIKNG